MLRKGVGFYTRYQQIVMYRSGAASVLAGTTLVRREKNNGKLRTLVRKKGRRSAISIILPLLFPVVPLVLESVRAVVLEWAPATAAQAAKN